MSLYSSPRGPGIRCLEVATSGTYLLPQALLLRVVARTLLSSVAAYAGIVHLPIMFGGPLQTMKPCVPQTSELARSCNMKALGLNVNRNFLFDFDWAHVLVHPFRLKSGCKAQLTQ